MFVGLKAGATPFRIAFQYSSLVELVTRLGSSPCRLVSCHAHTGVCDDVLTMCSGQLMTKWRLTVSSVTKACLFLSIIFGICKTSVATLGSDTTRI